MKFTILPDPVFESITSEPGLVGHFKHPKSAVLETVEKRRTKNHAQFSSARTTASHISPVSFPLRAAIFH